MFKKIIILLGLILSLPTIASGNDVQIQCEAIFQTVVDDQQVVKKADLTKIFEDVRVIQMATDIGDYHYFIQGDKKTQEYLVMITLGPNYTSGVTSAITWDQKNQMRVTRVDGHDVYKVYCN